MLPKALLTLHSWMFGSRWVTRPLWGQFGTHSSSHRTGKDQFPSQFQRRTVIKNVQTTRQLCSFLMLIRLCSKILQARLQQYLNWELPNIQAGFKKSQRNQRSNCQHLLGNRESKGIPEKISISASLTMKKPLTVWITANWKILRVMWIPDHLTCLSRNLNVGQEPVVRNLHEHLTGSKLGKCYNKAVYCHPVYLTYAHRVHYVKCLVRWVTSWNQDCQEIYQQPQICKWFHFNGRKQGGS